MRARSKLSKVSGDRSPPDGEERLVARRVDRESAALGAERADLHTPRRIEDRARGRVKTIADHLIVAFT